MAVSSSTQGIWVWLPDYLHGPGHSWISRLVLVSKKKMLLLLVLPLGVILVLLLLVLLVAFVVPFAM